MTFIMSPQLLPYLILHIDVLPRYITILDSIVVFDLAFDRVHRVLLDMNLFSASQVHRLLLPFAASPDIVIYIVL